MNIAYAQREGRDWAKQNPNASIFEQDQRRQKYAAAWGDSYAQQFYWGMREQYGDVTNLSGDWPHHATGGQPRR
jgi:hypothetical protein